MNRVSRPSTIQLGDHHDPEGGFRNPWPTSGERGSGLRWALQRITGKLPSDPSPDEIPRARPVLRQTTGGRHWRGAEGERRAGTGRSAGDGPQIHATWVGHATFLLEIGGQNLLTDPHWSQRASPVSWAGPKRLSPPGVPLRDLPRIDAVLLSHDHFDHLDEPTVRVLSRRHGEDLLWCAPLGYAAILRKWGATRITELDWYESVDLSLPSGTALGPGSGDSPENEPVEPESGASQSGVDGSAARGSSTSLEAVFLPAQHWSARTPFSRNRRLWGSWAIHAGGRSIYFGGDSGWFPEYPRIGERAGPFDLVLLPIGAYAPRWFMKPVHMTPAEAVRSYQELGGRGVFAGMHWGTFRLSDEHPLEPPVLARRAWEAAGLPAERLWLPAIGETRHIRSADEPTCSSRDTGFPPPGSP